MVTSVLYSWTRCWISPRSMGYRWDPLPNSFLTPPTPHPCHAPPLPPPTLAETTGNILPEAGMRGKSKSLPWDVSKTGQQTVHYWSLSIWGHTEDSIKAAIVYSTTKRKIIDSTTATLQLSSLKSNNESRRRKGSKEMRKRKQVMTHFSSVYSLLFYEIVNQAWTWWRWWKVVKEPA